MAYYSKDLYVYETMKTILWNQLTIALLFSLACSITPHDASARSPSFLRSSTKSVSRAITMNTRQIFKPTLKIISRYAGAMNTVAFSRDGRWMATGGANGAAQIWDLTTGQREMDLRKKSGSVLSAAFTSDNRFLVTGHNDGTIVVWNRKSGKPIRKLRDHSGPVSCVIFPFKTDKEVDSRGLKFKVKQVEKDAVTAETDESRFLVTAGADGAARLWNIQSGALVKKFPGHRGAVLTLAAGNGNDLLVTGGEDGRIKVWNRRTGTLTKEIDRGRTPVNSIALGIKDRLLAAGFKNGSFLVWDLISNREIFYTKGHSGAVKSVAFSPDNTTLATCGKDRVVRLWSLQNGKILGQLEGHEDTINSVAFSPDRNHIVTAGNDRTVRFWERDSYQEITRLISMRDGWAVVSPEGYFDGTLDGDLEDRLDAIQWTINKRAYGVDGFLEGYYRPALLGRVLAGISLKSGKGTPNISQGFYLPPEMRISSPMPDSRLRDRRIKVVVEASDLGGGINEIRLFQNGKILDDEKAQRKVTNKGKQDMRESKTYSVVLADGENLFKAIGFNNDRIEGEPAEIAVSYVGSDRTPPPALHLFVVGINGYRNSSLDLNFCVPDANGIVKYFSLSYKGLFAAIKKNELYDSQATRKEILSMMRMVENVPSQDTVVIYFAGHGDTVGDDWFFVPYDISSTDNDNILRKTGISSPELRSLITKSDAGRILLLLDSCKSGAAVDFMTEFEDHRPFALLTRATGIHIAAAAARKQYASELKQLGHGVFTYSLLEALQGKADRKPFDGHISVLEILSYIKKIMPELISRHKIQSQRPITFSKGLDFTVSKPN